MFVRLEVDQAVGTIRLDRPPMNALNAEVQAELKAAADEATVRKDIRAVVVYGGEKVFAAGADIKEMAELTYAEMVDRSGLCKLRSPPWHTSRSRRWRLSLATPSGAVASWPSPATCGSRLRTPSSVSRRSSSGSSQGREEPSGCPGWSDRRVPRS